MDDQPTSDSVGQSSVAVNPESAPKYTQQEWSQEELEILGEVKDAKSEYGMSYKELLLFAALAIDSVDSNRVAEIVTETFRQSNAE